MNTILLTFPWRKTNASRILCRPDIISKFSILPMQCSNGKTSSVNILICRSLSARPMNFRMCGWRSNLKAWNQKIITKLHWCRKSPCLLQVGTYARSLILSYTKCYTKRLYIKGAPCLYFLFYLMKCYDKRSLGQNFLEATHNSICDCLAALGS